MKKIIFSILFIISSLFSYELDWTNDYDKALELAQKQNKSIYLFIGADRCHFCKNFKDNTLSRKCVKARLKSEFITVYLSRDQHHIPDKFEKLGVPRHYFLSPNGEIIFETAGAFGSESFLEILDDVEMHIE